jgi:hypothetical protein
MPDEVKYDPPVTLKAGEIQFIEACHPALVAGGYEAHTGMQIRENKDAKVPWNSDPYASSVAFRVDAPRFTLDPADIHSVYPPVNATGSFDNSLPHVVFTRRTLPWERTLDGIPPRFGKPFLPWMALLLLQEDELRSSTEVGKVRPLPVFSEQGESLLRSDSKDVLVPDVGQKDAGQKGTGGPGSQIRSASWLQEKFRYTADAKCLAIDLPAQLFKAVTPRNADLTYLAHVRQVDTGNKEVLGINDKGWFSLVMGNRLPQPQKSHRVFLVSLEGFQDCLTEDWVAEEGRKVRLAVLVSWSFTCEGENNFKRYMHELNNGSSTSNELPESALRLPFKPYENLDGAAKTVNSAYSLGYTAFDHLMRHGESTVSWYRGPLVPLNYAKPQQIQEPASGSDELLRYDPETGVFDATYAAAWQLGRLLALQNQAFALALDRARRGLRAQAELLLRREELRELREKLGLPAADDDLLEDSVMAYFSGGAGDQLAAALK